MPAAVTIPDEDPIVAIVVALLLHVPPVGVTFRVVVGEPEIQRFVEPLIALNVGNGLTVIVVVEYPVQPEVFSV